MGGCSSKDGVSDPKKAEEPKKAEGEVAAAGEAPAAEAPAAEAPAAEAAAEWRKWLAVVIKTILQMKRLIKKRSHLSDMKVISNPVIGNNLH